MSSTQNRDFDTALGVGAGASTYYCTKKFAGRPINKLIMQNAVKFTPEENEILKNAITDAFEQSGLKQKGVSLVHVDKINREEILKDFAKKIEDVVRDIVNKHFKTKKKVINSAVDEGEIAEKLEKAIKLTSKGKNAFYHPFTKQIMVNTKEMPFAAFHEMGHAINNNMSKWTNYLHWGRHGFAMLAPVFVAIGLLKNKKQEGETPKSTGDKITTFIKNNCGKLAFLAMVPTMAEEGLASINGAKLAKKVLSPELFKKVCKSNSLAWSTYLVGATMVGLGANLAVKVRDKIAQPKSVS